MTSGEAIIFCINDEKQPVMRKMDFVLRRSTADYGQQQWREKVGGKKKKLFPQAVQTMAFLAAAAE